MGIYWGSVILRDKVGEDLGWVDRGVEFGVLERGCGID